MCLQQSITKREVSKETWCGLLVGVFPHIKYSPESTQGTVYWMTDRTYRLQPVERGAQRELQPQRQRLE